MRVWQWLYDRCWSVCEWIYWNHLTKTHEEDYIEDVSRRGKYTVIPNPNGPASVSLAYAHLKEMEALDNDLAN